MILRQRTLVSSFAPARSFWGRGGIETPAFLVLLTPKEHSRSLPNDVSRYSSVFKRQLPFRTAKLLDYDCLSGDFGKSAAGFKVKNYLIGAQRLAAAGECAILFITGKRTADR